MGAVDPFKGTSTPPILFPGPLPVTEPIPIFSPQSALL